MRSLIFLIAGICIITGPGGCTIGEKPAEVSFNEDVRPILNERCLICHGGVRKSGGFSLLTREDALAPTQSGRAAIVPGHPDSSELIRLVKHEDPGLRMPQNGPPVSEEQVAILEKWIEEGARWEPIWSLIPPKTVSVPEVSKMEWPKNEIDRFVLARLEESSLSPAAEAGCAVLVRRLYLDITGLPPTPAEVENFCRKGLPGSYEELVDELLASPHFGEKWASMWLDLARYADSKGYEADRHRDIWKYRDWVIDAFNRDLSFDEFTIDQLAGDLLPDHSRDQLIATAFHRNTMNNDEGGTDDEEFRVAAVIDRVNTTWEVWQGITFSCVQCHGHPYDPFKQKEYYEFLAFFNNTADADRPDESPTIKVYEKAHETRARALLASLGTLDSIRDPEQLASLKRALDTLPGSTLPVIRELSAEDKRTTHIFERGNFLMKGEEVQPGVPAAMPGWPDSLKKDRLGLARWLVSQGNPLTARVTVNRFWAQIFGTGIVETLEDFGSQGEAPSHPGLLDWLARSFMKDMEWSMKKLIKTIVCSATYRQSSAVNPELLEADPFNRLLSRGPKIRLSAEQIRDQALAVSGLLNRKMYGPSVMPLQPDNVWQVVYNDMSWQTSEGEDRYRRALYTYWRRTSPYPSMIAFDSPSREFCVSRRIHTNTPLQALVTLNDPVYFEAATALADRMRETDSTDLSGQIHHGYKLALGRSIDTESLDILLKLYRETLSHYQSESYTGESIPEEKRKREALTVVANAIMNLDAFLTKN